MSEALCSPVRDSSEAEEEALPCDTSSTLLGALHVSSAAFTTVATQGQPRACWRADGSPGWMHSRADGAGRHAGSGLLRFWQQL